MDLRHPLDVVGRSPQGRTLAVLARTDHPLTGRAVGRLVEGFSQSTVERALRTLVAAGIVDRSDQPPAALYSLNRGHLAAPAVESLARARARLIDRIAWQCVELDRAPVAVALFGSVARGEATADSDIDLLIVRPADVPADDDAWAEQIAALTSSISRSTGNPVSLLEYTPEELRSADHERVPILDAIRREARQVFGEPLTTLLQAGAASP
jgi:predicted nucleotidyltransferase